MVSGRANDGIMCGFKRTLDTLGKERENYGIG